MRKIVIDLPLPPGVQRTMYGWGISHVQNREGQTILEYPHEIVDAAPSLYHQLVIPVLLGAACVSTG